MVFPRRQYPVVARRVYRTEYPGWRSGTGRSCSGCSPRYENCQDLKKGHSPEGIQLRQPYLKAMSWYPGTVRQEYRIKYPGWRSGTGSSCSGCSDRYENYQGLLKRIFPSGTEIQVRRSYPIAVWRYPGTVRQVYRMEYPGWRSGTGSSGSGCSP